MRVQLLKLAALLFLTVAFGMQQSRLLPAAGDDCLKTKEATLKKVDDAFTPREDLLLKLSGELKGRGVDPRAVPSVAVNGSVETLDLIEVLSNLAQAASKARSEIEKAAIECTDKKSAPAKMIALADSFYAAAQSLTEPLEHLGTRTRRFREPIPLTPEARNDLLQGLNADNSIASVIRDPSCAVLPSGCKTHTQFSALDEALKKLIAGNVAFNDPQRMIVSQPELVEVKLSTTLSPSQLKDRLTEEGSKAIEGLSVGDRMSATLNGGAAFDIAPSGPQTQWISQTDVTTWTWDVTPKISGTQYLILSFDAIITINGKDAVRNVRTLTHEIQVDVGWPSSPAEWFEFLKKWFENISWVWASVLVPVGLLIAGWWHRRATRH